MRGFVLELTEIGCWPYVKRDCDDCTAGPEQTKKLDEAKLYPTQIKAFAAAADIARKLSLAVFKVHHVMQTTETVSRSEERIEFATVFSKAPAGAKRKYVLRAEENRYTDRVIQRTPKPVPGDALTYDLPGAQVFEKFEDAQLALNDFLLDCGKAGSRASYRRLTVYPVDVWPAKTDTITKREIL